MRDDHMGGLLAFIMAAPIMVVCCAGGGVILAAVLGGIGGWLTGLCGSATAVVALFAMLMWRDIRRSRARRAAANHGDPACCGPVVVHKSARPGPTDA